MGEAEADAINWMEAWKSMPAKCYCGHWFRLVDFEEYFASSEGSWRRRIFQVCVRVCFNWDILHNA